MRLPIALSLVAWFVVAGGGSPVAAREAIRLVSSPALSPDGANLAFSWRGDIWIAPSNGGKARQLTTHSARDTNPCFSPDGRQLAFTSERTGPRQVYVISVAGGFATQVTFHSEGCSVEQWFPDQSALLINGVRDHFWHHAERFFRVNLAKRSNEELLFDASGREASLSPDGKKLLFTREGVAWWRKGYRGSQASQVWLYDLDKSEFRKLVDHETGCRSPLWQPDGKGFYYVGAQNGSFNLWQRDLDTGKERCLTDFHDDSVVMPCIARDGKTIVFRHLFDLYRFQPASGQAPQRIDLVCDSDTASEPVVRRLLQSATEVSFSRDGLEVAMIAGGDLWVMDSELREPRQITRTAEEERSPAFAPDGRSILFISDTNGQSDVWQAVRADLKKYWWQNDRFVLTRITDDGQRKNSLQWSPVGDRVAVVKGRGDLWVMDPDGRNARRVLEHWDRPSYNWSPDGKWLTYAVFDNDFNRDVWVLNLEGTAKPVNLSCHPSNDSNPVWSPDGRMIAFTGRRQGNDVDLYFVYLQKEEEETDSHDRAVQRAVEKLRKARLKSVPSTTTPEASEPGKANVNPATGTDRRSVASQDSPGKHSVSPLPANAAANKSGTAQTVRTHPVTSKDTSRSMPKSTPNVRIDFDRIADRIHQVSIPKMAEGGLFWSPDSKRLAFTASIDGKAGVYTISPPDDLRPKLLASVVGHSARWIEHDNRIVWLSGGVPGSVASTTGEAVHYSFSVAQQVDVAARFAAAFDLCWRTLRDDYYDSRLGNRNWDEIRRKYAPMAKQVPSIDTFGEVVCLMLGELNGSHLGFFASEEQPEPGEASHLHRLVTVHSWRETTAHLGARFDPTYRGLGCKVRDVIEGSPANLGKSRLSPGDIVLSVNGTAIQPGMDLTLVLNGPPQRDIDLRVRNTQGVDRDVELRPITYARARSLLYEQWIRQAQKTVVDASHGKLGYLHVRSMDMPSFYQFERDLYAVGAGREGLIIDLRENGGGSTTDHLLTALTQPVHAITVPRGGTAGYPQDRKVYATWDKPIVVLCNQNSFSNAEIFTHAIKTLKRGPVVGVPTAGGVISRGVADIMDVGRITLPRRGWFRITDGEDMELNGAVPDYIVWPNPGDLCRGKDQQLAKAIEVLQDNVQKHAQRSQPTPRKASQRPTFPGKSS